MKVNLKQGKLEMNEWPDQVIVNFNVNFLIEALKIINFDVCGLYLRTCLY